MNTKKLITQTLNGLYATAQEKINVLGQEDAKEDIKQIIEMAAELIRFWGIDEDENLITSFENLITE